MAANYWESTHHKNWLFTKEELAARRRQLESDNAEVVQMFTLPETRHLYIFFNQRETPTLLPPCPSSPTTS